MFSEFDSLTDHEKALWIAYDSIAFDKCSEWLDENEDFGIVDVSELIDNEVETDV